MLANAEISGTIHHQTDENPTLRQDASAWLALTTCHNTSTQEEFFQNMSSNRPVQDFQTFSLGLQYDDFVRRRKIKFGSGLGLYPGSFRIWNRIGDLDPEPEPDRESGSGSRQDSGHTKYSPHRCCGSGMNNMDHISKTTNILWVIIL